MKAFQCRYTSCSTFTETNHKLETDYSREYESRMQRDLQCTDNNCERFMDGTTTCAGKRLPVERMTDALL